MGQKVGQRDIWKVILAILKSSGGKCTQKQIKEELAKKEIDISQPAISNYLKDNGWVRLDGIWTKMETIETEKKIELLRHFFKGVHPRILGPFFAKGLPDAENNESSSKGTSKGIYTIIVRVRIGYEASLGQLIYEIYRRNIYGVVPGYGCILIYVGKRVDAKSIVGDLKELIPRENGEDDPAKKLQLSDETNE